MEGINKIGGISNNERFKNKGEEKGKEKGHVRLA